MFIIGSILANRCSVKMRKVKVKKMTWENLWITKNAMKAASCIQGFYLREICSAYCKREPVSQFKCFVGDRESWSLGWYDFDLLYL